MYLSEYTNIFNNETTHFYYVSIHALVLSTIRKYFRSEKQLDILDAGCGTGLLGVKMKLIGNVVGIDKSQQAIHYSKLRGLRVFRASVTNIPFKANTFNVVTSIDVIYHEWVKDDMSAIREMLRVLKPNGLLILRVPAFDIIRRPHDDIVYTRHRYEKHEIEKKLIDAGFKIDKLSYVGVIFYLASLINILKGKLFNISSSESDIHQIPILLNIVLTHIMFIENTLLTIMNFPFGIGVFCVARK